MKNHLSTKMFFMVCLSEERFVIFREVTWEGGVTGNSGK